MIPHLLKGCTSRNSRKPLTIPALLCALAFVALSDAQQLSAQCNVNGGELQATSAAVNVCVTGGGPAIVSFSVSGSEGIGRFGLVHGPTGDVVAVNATGQFNMALYPEGNYIAGHVAVDNLATLNGITNVLQLSGCYSLSNTIAVNTVALDAGFISAPGPPVVTGGVLTFAISGAVGPNQRFVLLDQSGTQVLGINTTGGFSFDALPVGTYKAAHIAYSNDVVLAQVNPLSLPGCLAVSNLLNISKVNLGSYPPGTVFCESGPAEVVEVLNPLTSRIWMDRNLGAGRAATGINDQAAYGDLYQWGRFSDGHQCRNAPLILQVSETDTPGHGSFISPPNNVLDWRATPNNNLWQGAEAVNNPCPAGFRLPTQPEWVEEIGSWTQNNATGAFESPLKLPAGKYKPLNSGAVFPVGNFGSYWASTVVNNVGAAGAYFDATSAGMGSSAKANAHSVRCIKD